VLILYLDLIFYQTLFQERYYLILKQMSALDSDIQFLFVLYCTILYREQDLKIKSKKMYFGLMYHTVLLCHELFCIIPAVVMFVAILPLL